MKTAFAVLFLSTFAFGQTWSGILDTTRAIGAWSNAGVTGGIPANRTTICKAENTGVSLATLNADIAACSTAHPLPSDPGGIVTLPAGSFSFSSSVVIKPNVTLRGAGANLTLLSFSGTGNCGWDGSICIEGDENSPAAPVNTYTWTAGFSAGSTIISIGSAVNGSISTLQVGMSIYLDACNQGYSGAQCGTQGTVADTGNIWPCDDTGATNDCATEGGEGLVRTERSQSQVVTLKSCDGNSTYGHTCSSGANMTISPAIYMPNWASLNNPQVSWNNQSSFAGVENLSIDNTNAGSFGVVFLNVHDCWAKGMRSMNAGRAHFFGEMANHITVRDSYIYGTQNAQSQSYGFETDGDSDWLAENNISHKVTGPINWGKSASGQVADYNYAVDDYYQGFSGGDSATMQASYYHHASGMDYNLFEGNIGTGFTGDAIHGTQFFMTAFRNRLYGWEPNKSSQTSAVNDYAYNRYFNIVGNILGTLGYHNVSGTYQCFSTGATDSCASGDARIFTGGFASGGYNDGTGNIHNDPKVSNSQPGVQGSLLRWGNWDVITNAVRWCGNSSDTGWSTTCSSTSEVPTTITLYSNAVPSTETLPASFIYAAQPTAWWVVGSYSAPWPPIGPDVSNGNVIDSGGHANRNPAAACFQTLLPDASFTSGHTATITNCTESGEVATCTATGTLPTPFVEGRVVNVQGNGVAGYNGNWQMTAVTTNTVQFSLASGLGTGSGGTLTGDTPLAFNANTCYQSSGVQGMSAGWMFAKNNVVHSNTKTR